MNWTYDMDAQALYVYLVDERPAVQVEEGPVVFDVGESGEVVGIEFLVPALPWPLDDWRGRFNLSDEAVAYLAFLKSSALASIFVGPRDSLVAEDRSRGLASPGLLQFASA